ncbi:rh224 [macacine betaherpesvirus 3]|uniref:Rh224 n=1 Tax=Rhesus cytomegalovirus (strain 68-1) TaxID=47929 RepID=Q7TFC0_RHCM6|nr:rh224 [macacine betaherpesvirus 3]AAP50744.1 rh224 [macacine betaherpesvirus 3]
MVLAPLLLLAVPDPRPQRPFFRKLLNTRVKHDSLLLCLDVLLLVSIAAGRVTREIRFSSRLRACPLQSVQRHHLSWVSRALRIQRMVASSIQLLQATSSELASSLMIMCAFQCPQIHHRLCEYTMRPRQVSSFSMSPVPDPKGSDPKQGTKTTSIMHNSLYWGKGGNTDDEEYSGGVGDAGVAAADWLLAVAAAVLGRDQGSLQA